MAFCNKDFPLQTGDCPLPCLFLDPSSRSHPDDLRGAGRTSCGRKDRSRSFLLVSLKILELDGQFGERCPPNQGADGATKLSGVSPTCLHLPLHQCQCRDLEPVSNRDARLYIYRSSAVCVCVCVVSFDVRMLIVGGDF